MSTLTGVQQRILELAKEIEQLSSAPVAPHKYFEEFLKRLVAALGAPAGAIWMLNRETARLEVLCEQGLGDTALASEAGALASNERLLLEAMGGGQARAFARSTADVKLPTEHQLLIVPLRQEKRSIGVVEIFQRPDASDKARLGFLQFVEQMCGHACRYLDTYDKRKAPASVAQQAGEFEQFVLNLHGSLHVRDVAATAAADGRLFVGCDRLGVAIQRGRQTVLTAISGQDSVNRRAKLVKAIERLVASVIATRKPLVYSGALDRLPPQIENPLAAYIEETGARMVAVIPLLEPERSADDRQEQPRRASDKAPPKVIGGLIVEQFFEGQPAPGLEQNLELLKRHVSSAVANARAHERLFLLPFRRIVGHVRSLFEGRLLWKTLGVLVLCALFVVALFVVPYDYRVEGNGHLMPVSQRSVFCPWEGQVIEVYVDNGDRVAAGETLLVLRNDELHARLLAARNEIDELQTLLAAQRAELDRAIDATQHEEQIRLQGEIVKSEVKLEGTRQQVAILEQEEALLTVRAPIGGVVATFQVDRLLKNRPVERGALLLDIMDDSGPWRLELEVDEHRVGHLLRAQQRLGMHALPVEFVLATNVESTFTGKLEALATRANKSEEGNIVEVFATIDDADLPQHQIGAEVRVKINCGQRRLGYVLFGDVVEFLQKHLWL